MIQQVWVIYETINYGRMNEKDKVIAVMADFKLAAIHEQRLQKVADQQKSGKVYMVQQFQLNVIGLTSKECDCEVCDRCKG